MREYKKHFPVNWIDGMKLNKNHFIEQDNAWTDQIQELSSINLSPVRYGILPSSSAGETTFNVKISLDNQNALKVTVLNCQAITSGGMRISIPALSANAQQDAVSTVSQTFTLGAAGANNCWWVFLFVHPYEKIPAGNPDINENPPRLPYVFPSYSLQLINDASYREFADHPYALPIGKVDAAGNDIRVDDDYLPPCLSLLAHPDLLALHHELDKQLSDIELYCARIVQKILAKKQQNEISDLVLFLCDRLILHIGQTINTMRWTLVYEPPVHLFMQISTLARVMKNTIDLRIGSGKDEMMTYFSEWCELNQGELETMLAKNAANHFNHNDVNKSIREVVVFIKTILRMFETLSKLEFIGKKKDIGIFVKEERSVPQQVSSSAEPPKTKRRFFG